jgi:phosphoglycerol transferase MdoB-like AlkP superfamily enzyme
MKKIINYFIRLIIFWLLFFMIGRLFFILSGLERIKEAGFWEVFMSFPAALRLDISTISYILVFPVIILLTNNWISKNIHNWIIRIYHYILIFAVVLITISSARLFLEWGSLLNYRAMVFVFEPDSVTGSVAFWDLLKMLLLAGSFIALNIFLFHKIVRFPQMISIKSTIFFTVVISVFLAIGMRGGLQKYPVTESVAYYSDNVYLNNAATNPAWYLAHSISQASLKNTERFTTIPDAKAMQLLKNLFVETEPDIILKENISSPNIVIIILESWSADLIERLGGEQGVTPVFDSLSRQGILFGDIYSSGFRTDQGLVSLYSGYPAQPSHSIIQHLEKVSKLPFMPLKLKDRGYASSFYYGGNIKFANMQSYLQLAGFDNIYSKSYFTDEEIKFTNWGAHDEYVLLQQAKDLRQLKEPFISTVLTLSTHEPYDVPLPLPVTDLNEPEMYNRSAFYTDYSLGKYFEYARLQPWYSNTLFVLAADHGHRLPRMYSAFEKGIRHMPVLFFGEVIKEEARGRIVETTGNLHDLPVTLLTQLGMETQEFNWSKDLLSPDVQSFAYIGYEKGFGWVQPFMQTTGQDRPGQDRHRYLLYLYPQGQINQSGRVISQPSSDSLLQYPKAYIQVLYKDFLTL